MTGLRSGQVLARAHLTNRRITEAIAMLVHMVAVRRGGWRKTTILAWRKRRGLHMRCASRLEVGNAHLEVSIIRKPNGLSLTMACLAPNLDVHCLSQRNEKAIWIMAKTATRNNRELVQVTSAVTGFSCVRATNPRLPMIRNSVSWERLWVKLGSNDLQLLDRASMKNAAKCNKQCESRNLVNHQLFGTTLRLPVL